MHTRFFKRHLFCFIAVLSIQPTYAEDEITLKNREWISATSQNWIGSVSIDENTCYYSRGPESRINFKAKSTKRDGKIVLNGFQTTPMTLEKVGEADQGPSFMRYRPTRLGRLRNCGIYETLTFEWAISQNSASMIFFREVWCGGLQMCYTTFKGSARRGKRLPISGSFKGYLSASNIDTCNNESEENFVASIKKTNKGYRYFDDFTDSWVPLSYDPSVESFKAKYSFDWEKDNGDVCKITATADGSFWGPGQLKLDVSQLYTCGSHSYRCDWSSFDLWRKNAR
jgi:hypothetical protein